MQCCQSFWRESIDVELTPYPGGAIHADTAVIGSGFCGLSTALHLLRRNPGRKVVVLEAGELAYGASSRSAGMLTPGVGQNLPGIVRRVGAEMAKSMYEATLRAVEYVGQLTAEEGIDCQLQMSGQLIVAHGRSGRQRIAKLAATLEHLALPHTVLGDEDLVQTLRLAVPAPSVGPAALRLPIAGVLNPGLLVSGLARAARQRGAELYSHARVLTISRDRPVRLTIAGGGEVRADEVVVATSAYSEELNVQRGRVIPMHLRVVLTTPLEPWQMARIGWSGGEGIIDSRRIFNYFRLTEDRRVLLGGGMPLYGPASANYGRDATPQLEPLCRELSATFGEDLNLRVDRAWSGPIGYVLDNLPIVQRLTNHAAVVFAGGWCGHGIALSVSSGKWIADMVEGAPLPNLPWFRASAPLIPFEPLRRIAVPAGCWGMSVLDRL